MLRMDAYLKGVYYISLHGTRWVVTQWLSHTRQVGNRQQPQFRAKGLEDSQGDTGVFNLGWKTDEAGFRYQ